MSIQQAFGVVMILIVLVGGACYFRRGPAMARRHRRRAPRPIRIKVAPDPICTRDYREFVGSLRGKS